MGGIVSRATSSYDHTKATSIATARAAASSAAHYSRVVSLMLPTYYVQDALTREKLETAKGTWASLLSDQAPKYKTLCKNEEFASRFPSALSYFCEYFFARLFDVHPSIIPALSKVSDRDRFMRTVIEFALSDLSDEEQFKSTLEVFAVTHHRRGVRAIECQQHLCSACFTSLFV